MMMLVGVYVFLSPWIIPTFFPGSTVMPVIGWSHYIVGVAIAVMGMAALASFQLWQEWLILILGLWLPFRLGFLASRTRRRYTGIPSARGSL
ncbi:SPW repeat protein [Mesorhizobium amorphae]|uniref:SPW repeat protein n=1 Tax=Mesorhizobium amorphae TaxID=71433 RepID=UPI003F5083D6